MAVIHELIEKAEAEIRDKKAKKAGFIIAITGELYTRTLGRNSAVYIEWIGNQWEAWRETQYLGKKEFPQYKVIATGREFEFVLLKAKRYFDYIERKRGGRMWM